MAGAACVRLAAMRPSRRMTPRLRSGFSGALMVRDAQLHCAPHHEGQERLPLRAGHCMGEPCSAVRTPDLCSSGP
jgi:hypothetical protein